MGFNKLLETVGIIFILIGIGFFLSKNGMVKERDTKALSDIIIFVATPALMFHGMIDSFDRELIINAYSMPVFGMLMSLVSLVLALLAAKVLKIKSPDKKDIFVLSCIFSNTVFVGLPVIVSLYGNKSVGPIFMYDLGMGMVFWTLGMHLVNKSSGVNIAQALKNLISFPLIAFVLSTIVAFLGIKPPNLLMEAARMVGGITIPLSMLLIGIIVGMLEFDFKAVDYTIIPVIIIRLILCPVILALIVIPLGIPDLLKKIIILEAGMPVMLTTAILARTFNKDFKYATTCVFITTLLSLITIPVIAYFIEFVL